MKSFVKKSVLFATIISCLIFFGCAPSLESDVKAFQSELPVYLGEGMTITKCFLKGNMLEYVIEADESDYSLEDKYVQSSFKRAMEESKTEFLRDGDDDIIELLRLCKKEFKGVRYIMVGAKSRVSFVCMEFSPVELQDLSWL